jgi:hypothetical protein
MLGFKSFSNARRVLMGNRVRTEDSQRTVSRSHPLWPQPRLALADCSRLMIYPCSLMHRAHRPDPSEYCASSRPLSVVKTLFGLFHRRFAEVHQLSMVDLQCGRKFVVSGLLFAVFAGLRAFFRSRLDISLEILALRHQVAVLKRKRRRVRLTWIDRLFWIALRGAWSRWSDALVVVKPATVIAWHRAGFRLYWPWRSRSRGGGPRVSDEIRTLIRRMRSEDSGWGAPKIHGELLKLGLQVSERTVARYLRRLHPCQRNTSQNWLAFLSNHREVLVAFDFFSAPQRRGLPVGEGPTQVVVGRT